MLLLGMLFEERFMKRFGVKIYGCNISHYQLEHDEHRYRLEFRCFM